MCNGKCKCANLKEELEYYKMIYDKCVAFSQDLVRSTMRFQPLVVSENDFNKIEEELRKPVKRKPIKQIQKELFKHTDRRPLKEIHKEMDKISKRKPTKKQLKDLSKVLKKK